MVTIEVKNQQKTVQVSPPQIKTIVRAILRHEKVSNADLSIVFVTDSTIKSLNKKYLKHNYVTDVLAFDFNDRPFLKQKGPARSLDGEIVISATRARKQAKAFKTTAGSEILLYLVHGILHLIGYDDNKARDVEQMRKKEKALMAAIKAKVFLRK